MLVHVSSMAFCIRRTPESRVAFCLQHARLFYQHADRDGRGGTQTVHGSAHGSVFFFYASVNSLLEIRIKIRL